MIKELVEAGGSGYLIPVVLFVLVLYAFRGLFGLHGRRSQHRKEFLALWDSAHSQDDMWLEVAIRHLFGTYLPARVIRLALAQPDKSQALLDLSDLWSLIRFDPDSQTVSWLHKRHQTPGKRKASRVLLFVGYFVCAMSAVPSVLIAARSGPQTLAGWLYGVCAIVLGLIAFICLAREDIVKTAMAVGDAWLVRINRLAAPSDRDGFENQSNHESVSEPDSSDWTTAGNAPKKQAPIA